MNSVMLKSSGFQIPVYSPKTGEPDIPGMVWTSRSVAGTSMPSFIPPMSENPPPSRTPNPGIDDKKPVLITGSPGPVLIPWGNPITITFNPGSIGIDVSSILLAAMWIEEGQFVGLRTGIATTSHTEPSSGCSNQSGPLSSSISIFCAWKCTILAPSGCGALSFTIGHFARMYKGLRLESNGIPVRGCFPVTLCQLVMTTFVEERGS